MRQYNRSLFGEAFQVCQEVLLDRCKAMILAVNYIHRKGTVHVDLKESNIFVMDGVWFIGDFGSCVKYGEPVKTFTPGMYLYSELIGTSKVALRLVHASGNICPSIECTSSSNRGKRR